MRVGVGKPAKKIFCAFCLSRQPLIRLATQDRGSCSAAAGLCHMSAEEHVRRRSPTRLRIAGRAAGAHFNSRLTRDTGSGTISRLQ